ncbi:type II glyceraldehyde-3-phosphate dehydrogenase [Methanospirillum sp.]|uniref:type II glyceraldehyde-3-phosphate dehydrogenase n=1 Tax=Methanospirillum sp. TaxID=45200 RepID=UPI0035A1A399
MIKVAVNGYGTIGKRVADAVSNQKDMEIIGVSKTKPSAEALVAVQRGYPLYIADMSKKDSFEKAGIPVAGSIEDMLKKADIVVDGTPGGVGAANKTLYEKAGVKAIWQGGEKHEIAEFSFNAHANYRDAIGRQFVRVVSCNTTGLCRVIKAMDDAFGVMKVRAVMIRRGADPHVIKKGPIDAIVLDPPTIPSHHGPDVNTVLPHIDIVTMAMIVPATQMHMHAITIELKKEGSRDEVLAVMQKHNRIGLIKPETTIRSSAELKEYVMDIGRPRADLWENGIFEASVNMVGKELFLFQAIHQEADVVVENIDAIRAMMGEVSDPETSIRMTNEAMQFTAL